MDNNGSITLRNILVLYSCYILLYKVLNRTRTACWVSQACLAQGVLGIPVLWRTPCRCWGFRANTKIYLQEYRYLNHFNFKIDQYFILTEVIFDCESMMLEIVVLLWENWTNCCVLPIVVWSWHGALSFTVLFWHPSSFFSFYLSMLLVFPFNYIYTLTSKLGHQ